MRCGSPVQSRKPTARLALCTVTITVLSILSACTTSKAIRTPVLNSPTVEQAITNRETDKLIRWGGTVVSVENKSDHTLVEIVERPLTRSGTPKSTTKSDGRFIAKSQQFIDPENIKINQSITVSGILTGYTTGMIGEHEYVYPLVEINEYKIWPARTRRYDRPYYDTYWYDPYWGPYPYWYHGHYFRHRYDYW